MADRFLNERRQVMEVAKELERLGLVAVSSGNISVRVGDRKHNLMAITPTSKPYAELTVDEVAVVDYEGEPVEGDLPPSSEMYLHVAIYQARPDVQAVIHTHSIYASVCAVAGWDIPPLVDEVAVYLGGPIKAAQYGFPGTRDLADKAVAALEDRKAILLRNHGMAACGASLTEALAHCRLVERVAQIYVHARNLGAVNVLPADVVEKERTMYLMKLRAQQKG
ncbi:MAG: class II aldolase/adducin family protein [Dehalococcoidia bacterium]|nr:class II aldolase/adducin family protein [Dehalococcoidia bacterium]